jgi:hypothetical protein
MVVSKQIDLIQSHLSKLPRRAAVSVLSVTLIAVAGACSAPTPTPVSTIPTPIIVTLPPRTPEKSLTPQPPPATVTPTLSPTPAPSITASGPTLSSNAVNVYAIATAAPLNVGPFHLVPTNTNVDNKGTGLTLAYRTDDGAIYTVVIFLAIDLQNAVERYQAEVNSLTDKQPAKVGDEAIYAPTDLNLLFVIRFRNAVININRPPANGTVPTVKITADQATQLALLIYNAIPKS